MPHAHAVYSSINRPLTIGGAERRLFFAAVVAGGATFAMGSLLGGLLMFLALYAGAQVDDPARSATAADRAPVRVGTAVLRHRASSRR